MEDRGRRAWASVRNASKPGTLLIITRADFPYINTLGVETRRGSKGDGLEIAVRCERIGKK